MEGGEWEGMGILLWMQIIDNFVRGNSNVALGCEELMKYRNRSLTPAACRMRWKVWTACFMDINTPHMQSLTHCFDSLNLSAKSVSWSMKQLISQPFTLSLMHSPTSLIDTHTHIQIAVNQLREKENPSGIQTLIVYSLQRLHIVSEGRRQNVSSLKDWRTWSPAKTSPFTCLLLIFFSTYCSTRSHRILYSSRVRQQRLNLLQLELKCCTAASQSVCFITETMAVHDRQACSSAEASVDPE